MFRTALFLRPLSRRWYTLGTVGLTTLGLALHPEGRQRFIAYNKSIDIPNGMYTPVPTDPS